MFNFQTSIFVSLNDNFNQLHKISQVSTQISLQLLVNLKSEIKYDELIFHKLGVIVKLFTLNLWFGISKDKFNFNGCFDSNNIS